MKKNILLLCAFCLITKAEIPNGFGINFDSSMSRTNHFNRHKIGKWMKINRALYNKFIVESPEFSEEPRIPKIIHHIWVGSPLPERQQQLRKTWVENHPDWEFMFWDDQAIAEFGLQNQEAYDLAINLSEKSDIARYEILNKFGGLYVDTDFECLKPFDIFHHYLDFYTGLQYESDFRVFNGIIASIPGHPILKACINNIRSRPTQDRNLWSTLHRTGPFYFGDQIKKFLASYPERVVAFPISYFYPIPFWVREQDWDNLVKTWVLKDSFAIHHWHVSWNGYHR